MLDDKITDDGLLFAEQVLKDGPFKMAADVENIVRNIMLNDWFNIKKSLNGRVKVLINQKCLVKVENHKTTNYLQRVHKLFVPIKFGVYNDKFYLLLG